MARNTEYVIQTKGPRTRLYVSFWCETSTPQWCLSLDRDHATRFIGRKATHEALDQIREWNREQQPYLPKVGAFPARGGVEMTYRQVTSRSGKSPR